MFLCACSKYNEQSSCSMPVWCCVWEEGKGRVVRTRPLAQALERQWRSRWILRGRRHSSLIGSKAVGNVGMCAKNSQPLISHVPFAVRASGTFDLGCDRAWVLHRYTQSRYMQYRSLKHVGVKFVAFFFCSFLLAFPKSDDPKIQLVAGWCAVEGERPVLVE